MHFRGLRAGPAVALAAASAVWAAVRASVPVFLRSVVSFTDADVASVDAGRVVTKQLPAADKAEIAAFGAVRVQADKPRRCGGSARSSSCAARRPCSNPDGSASRPSPATLRA
jgi:hypothetical protein